MTAAATTGPWRSHAAVAAIRAEPIGPDEDVPVPNALLSQVVSDGHTPGSHPDEYGWIGYGLDRWAADVWRRIRPRLS